MEMIKRFIFNGIPVVIEKGYEPSNGTGWYGHYLTVYGYDDEAEQFSSLDTNLGPFDGRPRIDNYDEFLYWWQQFNYTFYILYTPAQRELVDQILPPELQDEQTMWVFTAQRAEAEIEADPDNVFAWFNLGVSLTRLGEIAQENNAAYYEAGAQAFDEARTIGLPTRALYYEHRPFMAYWKIGRLDDVLELADAMLNTLGGQWIEEIYWYQGHALIAQGDIIGARAAYEQALEVNPNFSPAEASLTWVLNTYYGE
jgi:tetratricopeptide (TPR) repeat protein